MDKRDCIYPDCQIKGEWIVTACEHSCPFEAEMKSDAKFKAQDDRYFERLR
jgi:hypothetical protein